MLSYNKLKSINYLVNIINALILTIGVVWQTSISLFKDGAGGGDLGTELFKPY